MSKILVAGTINIETTVRIDDFPIHYVPVRYPFFGVHSSVSGVGYNIARALTVLGHDVRFLSLIGHDDAGYLVERALSQDGIPSRYILKSLRQTPQSAILYDGNGRRQINVDLKDIQETPYPGATFAGALAGCEIAVLGNINFTRPFLQQAKHAGVLVATDVHAISSLDDDYNRDYMAAADILFMSHEHLPVPPRDWAKAIIERFGTALVVIGMGADGALLSLKNGYVQHFPAVKTRPIVNTIGAGDALFSAFVHTYCQNHDPVDALTKATLFASYKIGETGAAMGFLSESELNQLAREYR